MKFCLVLICVVVSALSVPTERALQEWNTFKTTHNKLYGDAEEERFRQRLFLEELQRVDENNEKYKEGLVSYEKGINQFSDLTPEEKQQFTACYVESENLPLSNVTEYVIPDGYVAPAEFDWRKKEGVVGRVKNQGRCGSCWAFSAAAALESQWALKKGSFVYLSEQNLVDCVRKNGCKGGHLAQAFSYVMRNNGIATEESYPYEASNKTCRYKPEMRGATMRKYAAVTEGDEEAMKAALVQIGPLAVALEATKNLVAYKGGLFRDPSCSNRNNHAVTIVGYGTENGKDYWLIRNSWSEKWGELGYFKLVRNENHCGIATDVWYPVVKQ